MHSEEIHRIFIRILVDNERNNPATNNVNPRKEIFLPDGNYLNQNPTFSET